MNTTSELLLQCNGLSKHFNGMSAVNDISFGLYQHELMVLLGPSGCGKSTLLRMIAGLQSPDKGNIRLHGKAVFDSGMNIPPEKRKVGMVFQDIALFPHLSVAENIAFGISRDKFTSRIVDEMLELVNLEGYGAKMPHELSGGEQQRVAIARAMAPEPALLLMDEPFSSLDYQLRVKLRAEVRDILKRKGLSAILVTHDQIEAFSFADRMLLLHQGAIIQEGLPAEIYHAPVSAWAAAFVGDANFFSDVEFQAFFPDHVFEYRESGKQIMIRPEDITVEKCSDALSGTVLIEKVEFHGSQQWLWLKTAGGASAHCRVHSRETWTAGESVCLRIHHHSFV
ncbi:MAG: ABC transporter ATP-binding protein [SAR324 cluster bacterium]|nr:ABC transporter ATP-binding protein [SAR324 cluster bacterium]